MWPWAHAAVGYLLYSSLVRVRRGTAPDGTGVLAVLLGTQTPDLIDKPLAWTFHVLPTGRSLGHSLFTLTLLVCCVTLVARRYDCEACPLPFALGYLSGVVTDLPLAVLHGDFSGGTFLLWPLLPSPTYQTEPSFTAHLATIELTPFFLVQVALGLALLGLWLFDGKPGLREVRTWVRSSVTHD